MSDNPATILYDPSGTPLTGAAGSPATPVLTVQGAGAGNPLPVSDGGGSLTVDGGVSVSNFPVSQVVEGSVAVSNFPATQPVQLSGYTSSTANQVLTGIGQTLGLDIQPGASIVTVLIKGTFSNSSLLTFTGSPDGGTTFFPIQAQMLGSPGIMATSISGGAAPYCFRAHVAGLTYFRVTCTAYLGGDAINVTLTSVATTASFVEPIVASSNTIGRVDLNSAIPEGSNTIGKVDQGTPGGIPWPVRMQANSSQYTQVKSVTSTVTLLVTNPTRVGACIFNNSTANLFLKLGSGATVVGFTVRLTSMAYYEVPFGYTGIITGVWSAANGAALVTEIT